MCSTETGVQRCRQISSFYRSCWTIWQGRLPSAWQSLCRAWHLTCQSYGFKIAATTLNLHSPEVREMDQVSSLRCSASPMRFSVS